MAAARRLPGLDKLPGEIGSTRHHVRDGVPVVLVTRPVLNEELIEQMDALGPEVHGLQTQGNTIVGECKFHLSETRLPAEKAEDAEKGRRMVSR